MRYLFTWHSWLFIVATLLVLLILAVILPIFLAMHKKKGFWSQNLRFTAIFSGITGIGLFILIYTLAEPYIVTIKHQAIDIGAPKPFTIALVADAQVSPFKRASFLNGVADKIISEKPFIVMLAGDFVNNETLIENELGHLAPLAKLTQAIPTIGVLGNHEYGIKNPNFPPTQPDVHKEVESALEALNVDLLKNDLLVVPDELGKPLFEIYGFDDLWNPNFEMPDLPQKTNLPRIVLSHNPDAVYLIDKTMADVVLSAHTHGGQIRLPFIGAFMNVTQKLQLKFYKGLSFQNGIPLFVTSGLGESGPPVRLFNLPEIVILEIK